jgi:hypothetical protein
LVSEGGEGFGRVDGTEGVEWNGLSGEETKKMMKKNKNSSSRRRRVR